MFAFVKKLYHQKLLVASTCNSLSGGGSNESYTITKVKKVFISNEIG